jgi:uncharacterized protein (DUF488 family)
MLYTIGHSNHPAGDFLALLRRHGISAVADVRSHPYSRFVPHFSRKPLEGLLAANGIAYVFLGRELGARSENPDCYVEGQVQFPLLARESAFHEGIARVRDAMTRSPTTLLCAEKDPVDCHRALLVARALGGQGVAVTHVHADGGTESAEAFEARLLERHGLGGPDLFSSREDRVERAYGMQAAAVAYRRPGW